VWARIRRGGSGRGGGGEGGKDEMEEQGKELSIFYSKVNSVHIRFLYLVQKNHLKQFSLSHQLTLSGA
jgi:hypothetical protein